MVNAFSPMSLAVIFPRVGSSHARKRGPCNCRTYLAVIQQVAKRLLSEHCRRPRMRALLDDGMQLHGGMR